MVWRQPWRLPRLPLLLLPVAGFLLRRLDHGGLKSAVMRILLAGTRRSRVQAWTAQYVRRVVPRRLFTDALHTIDAHRRAGDRLVLLSASPDLFVLALGAQLGFDQVLCTGVRWRGERLDGRLATANRRGAEKLRCLQTLRQQHPGCHITGYGNSPPDLLHLRACDAAVYVNPPARLAARLRREGLQVVRWR